MSDKPELPRDLADLLLELADDPGDESERANSDAADVLDHKRRPEPERRQPQPKRRKCLRCRAKFTSRGPGNRLCPKCRPGDPAEPFLPEGV